MLYFTEIIEEKNYNTHITQIQYTILLFNKNKYIFKYYIFKINKYLFRDINYKHKK